MVEKTYYCDLCEQERSEDELYGYKWVGGGVYHPNYKLQKSLKEGRHLCLQCIRCIIDSASDINYGAP